jgi:hypothetical protein
MHGETHIKINGTLLSHAFALVTALIPAAFAASVLILTSFVYLF